MERPSDAELMERTRQGDRRAFGVIVERYKDAMVNYLARLSGCRARAEDMAQEAFLRLFLHRDRYQEEGKLAALLYRIATNLARSEHRRLRRQQLLTLGLARSNGHDARRSPATPEALALSGEAQGQLLEAIRRVKLKFRVPLVLHEIEGLSYGEVAAVVGCGENTVKSRISRGRQMLKQRLNHYLDDGEPR